MPPGISIASPIITPTQMPRNVRKSLSGVTPRMELSESNRLPMPAPAIIAATPPAISSANRQRCSSQPVRSCGKAATLASVPGRDELVPCNISPGNAFAELGPLMPSPPDRADSPMFPSASFIYAGSPAPSPVTVLAAEPWSPSAAPRAAAPTFTLALTSPSTRSSSVQPNRSQIISSLSISG